MTQRIVNFLGEYPMFGDADPQEMIEQQLADAKSGELIFDYKFIYVFDAELVNFVLFEFTTAVEGIVDEVWPKDHNMLMAFGTEIANKIVNDSDAEVRGYRIMSRDEPRKS